MSRFTPIQSKMLVVLSDGLPHTRQELHACLSDELRDLSSIKFHLSGIRKKLRQSSQDIVCELYRGTIHYRHVQLLPSATDGKY